MSSPINILHLCSIKGRGGTGYMVSRLCRLLAKQGLNIIVGSCPGSKIEERCRKAGLITLDGLNLHRGFHPLSLLGDLKKIRHCLREKKVDLIHAWHSIEYWTAAAAIQGTNVKLARTRGLMTPIKPTLVNKIIHSKTSFVHVTCNRILNLYQESGLDSKKVKIVHDGVDLKHFHPDINGRKIRLEAGISTEVPVIASIGRLESVKGHKYLLTAFEKLRRKKINFQALLAGDGSLKPELQKQVHQAGLEGQVHFLGVRNDIPQVLAASNIFVLTSIGSEGSSRATQEAMACGLPVVVSNVGMLPDIVSNAKNGYLVEKEDPEALAVILQKLLPDKEKLQQLGKNAGIKAKNDFSENKFTENIRLLYEQALQG